jgi:transglutaminase-like putative cysteine protease
VTDQRLRRPTAQPPVATLGPSGVRKLVLDQRIRYGYSAPVSNLRQYLRVVPPTAHGRQRRRRWELRVEGVASFSLRCFSDPFGNLTLAVSAPRVDQAVEFVVRVEADTDTAGGGCAHGTVADLRCLTPTRLTAPDESISELAFEARGDIAALCERVHQSISYQWGITGVHTTAGEALAGGLGVCQDYAHIMLAACRRAGVPARYVSGHLTGEGGSHAWVEVLHHQPDRPGAWVAEGWDPTHNRRTDARYLVVAVGRDYSDAAPMWGTFEGEDVTSSLVVDKRLSA